MKLKTITDSLILMLLTISLLALSVFLYILYLYPHLDYEQLIITMNDLTPNVIKDNIYPKDYFFGLLTFIITWPLMIYFLKPKQQIFASVIIIIVLCYLSGYYDYKRLTGKTSDFYEKNYISPTDISYEFPNQKRNLILIYLESFENNFNEEKYYEESLIKNLSTLQNKDNHLKNYFPLSGTTYSIAALVSSQCAIPLRLMKNKDIYAFRYFLPQAICFPEILKQNGYQTKIMKAADIKFTNTDVFSLSHGYNESLGINELQEKYPELKDKKYHGTFGGLSDRTLFEYAKHELAQFKKDAPFFLTLFTLDTHTPTTYKDKECQHTFSDLRDSFKCSDKIVYDFIEWLKQSPYYENTTIILTGDHLLPTRIKTIGHPKRSVYNVFLNLSKDKKLKNHTYTSVDLPATILESLNIKLTPQAFGLGRSLFSDNKTLIERDGAKLSLHLLQDSNMYKKFNTPLEKRKFKYIPYSLNTTIQDKSFLEYTDAYEEFFNLYYIDRLYLKLDKQPTTDLTMNLKFNAIIQRGSSVIFKANKEEICTFNASIKSKPPYEISCTIKKELLKDNKLLLNFRNTKGVTSATNMGIAPLALTIKEQ